MYSIFRTDLAPADWIISSADRSGDRVRFTPQTMRIDRLKDYLAGAGGRCGRAGIRLAGACAGSCRNPGVCLHRPGRSGDYRQAGFYMEHV